MYEGADKNRYKITVDGTGIREYYEFDQNFSEREVAEKWLKDSAVKWGEGVAMAFADKVNVEQIAKKHEPPALPPCPDHKLTTGEESTK